MPVHAGLDADFYSKPHPHPTPAGGERPQLLGAVALRRARQGDRAAALVFRPHARRIPGRCGVRDDHPSATTRKYMLSICAFRYSRRPRTSCISSAPPSPLRRMR